MVLLADVINISDRSTDSVTKLPGISTFMPNIGANSFQCPPSNPSYISQSDSSFAELSKSQCDLSTDDIASVFAQTARVLSGFCPTALGSSFQGNKYGTTYSPIPIETASHHESFENNKKYKVASFKNTVPTNVCTDQTLAKDECVESASAGNQVTPSREHQLVRTKHDIETILTPTSTQRHPAAIQASDDVSSSVSTFRADVSKPTSDVLSLASLTSLASRFSGTQSLLGGHGGDAESKLDASTRSSPRVARPDYTAGVNSCSRRAATASVTTGASSSLAPRMLVDSLPRSKHAASAYPWLKAALARCSFDNIQHALQYGLCGAVNNAMRQSYSMTGRHPSSWMTPTPQMLQPRYDQLMTVGGFRYAHPQEASGSLSGLAGDGAMPSAADAVPINMQGVAPLVDARSLQAAMQEENLPNLLIQPNTAPVLAFAHSNERNGNAASLCLETNPLHHFPSPISSLQQAHARIVPYQDHAINRSHLLNTVLGSSFASSDNAQSAQLSSHPMVSQQTLPVFPQTTAAAATAAALVEQKRERSLSVEAKSTRLLDPLAVHHMSEWLKKHIDHPYPTQQEKKALAKRGNITVAQVSSWFANKRSRLGTSFGKNAKIIHCGTSSRHLSDKSASSVTQRHVKVAGGSDHTPVCARQLSGLGSGKENSASGSDSDHSAHVRFNDKNKHKRGLCEISPNVDVAMVSGDVRSNLFVGPDALIKRQKLL